MSETTITPQATEHKAAPGRPANPESARQKKIREAAEKRANGEMKLGRPTIPGSKRQQKLDEIAKRKNAGEDISRGRPKMSDEDKKAAAEKRAADKALLEEAKKLANPTPDVEPVVTLEVKEKTPKSKRSASAPVETEA